jgi:hypothetical protein
MFENIEYIYIGMYIILNTIGRNSNYFNSTKKNDFNFSRNRKLKLAKLFKNHLTI